MDSWTRWRTTVVQDLLRLRELGVTDFRQAWRMALAANPPRHMEQRSYLPTQAQMSLLDEESLEDEPEVSVVEFMRRGCSDAWKGRRPELADLPGALEGGLIRDRPPVGRGMKL